MDLYVVFIFLIVLMFYCFTIMTQNINQNTHKNTAYDKHHMKHKYLKAKKKILKYL